MRIGFGSWVLGFGRKLCLLFIIPALVITLVGGGCGKGAAPADTGDGPPWWKALPLQQREYIAELYRVGIAVSAWQEWQKQCLIGFDAHAPDDSLKAVWNRMLECRRIASDRARLALRLANEEQVKWLKPFLSNYLESQTPPTGNREALRNWIISLGQSRLEFTPAAFYLTFKPAISVTLGLGNREEDIILWAGDYPSPARIPATFSPPEPREERSPMGKLLRSSWLIPPDAGPAQVKRWMQMAQTEFDNPQWQLGGIPRTIPAR